MSISSLPGPAAVLPTFPGREPVARGEPGSSGNTPEVRRVEPYEEVEAGGPEAVRAELHQLKTLASRIPLEVRFETLQDGDVTVIRMVDPVTQEVVREFPPEGVARALTELRELAAARLDRKA